MLPFREEHDHDALAMLRPEVIGDAQVDEAIAELGALPAKKRKAIARDVDYAALARALAKAGIPLFRAVIEDPVLERADNGAIAEAALLAWLTADPLDGAGYGLARFDRWSADTQLALLDHIDASEAYELLHARFEAEPPLRKRLVRSARKWIKWQGFRDARWIDVALRLLARDPVAALQLLRIALPSHARARDELAGILQRALAVDDVIVELFDMLERARRFRDYDNPPFVDEMLAVLLTSPAGVHVAKSPLAFMVTLAADRLRELPVVQASDAAQRRIAACERERPLLTVG
jgi:hypothetical protein